MLKNIRHCYDQLNKFEEEKFYLEELMLVMKTSGEQLGREFAFGIKLKTNLFSLCSVWCNGSLFILVECNMAENYFNRGKQDKAMKLCQQVMEKLNDMEEHDQIIGKEFES